MISEDITVAVRVRPLLTAEIAKEYRISWEVPGPSSIMDLESGKLYLFDRVFPESNSTEALYEEIGENIIWRAMEGFNSCVIAYGQSGSGKSFTIQGSDFIEHSMIKLTLQSIFAYIQSSPNYEYYLKCSYIEIHNESIRDLFQPYCGDLKVNPYKPGSGYIEVDNLKEETLISITQACSLISLANTHKTSRDNSQSHAILRIIIEAKSRGSNEIFRQSTIHIADVAESEGSKIEGFNGKFNHLYSKSFADKGINCFKELINKLADTKSDKNFDYRCSVLTQILQPIFQGNCKILTICCLVPSSNNYDNSISTLITAKKLKKITTKVGKNAQHPTEITLFILDKQKKSLITQLEFSEKNLKSLSNSLPPLESLHESLRLDLEKSLKDHLSLQSSLFNISTQILNSSNVIHYPQHTPKEPLSLERRLIRYSISRTSADFKDDNFLMSILRANKPASKLNEKLDSLNLVSDRTLIDGIRKEKDSILQEIGVRDSMLIDKLDNLSQLFESFDPKQSLMIEDAAILRDSFAYLNTNEINREESSQTVEKLLVLVCEQDKIIDSLQARLLEKDDQLEIVQDELALCRNNLSNLQHQLRQLKSKNASGLHK